MSLNCANLLKIESAVLANGFIYFNAPVKPLFFASVPGLQYHKDHKYIYSAHQSDFVRAVVRGLGYDPRVCVNISSVRGPVMNYFNCSLNELSLVDFLDLLFTDLGFESAKFEVISPLYNDIKYHIAYGKFTLPSRQMV